MCYSRKQIEHLTLRLSAGETLIKNTDVKVAAVLADSAIRPALTVSLLYADVFAPGPVSGY